MVHCPRCGLLVEGEAAKCPRCGTEMPRVSEPARPERRGAVDHIKYATDMARKNPGVFIPGLIGSMLSLISGYLMESWDVYQDFMEYLWDLFEAQMEITPVAYTSDLFDYTRFVGWVPAAVLLLGLLGWASSLASIHASWSVLRGERLDMRSSYAYVLRNLTRFIVAGLWTALFTLLAVAVYVALIMGSDAIGLQAAVWIGLLFSAALIVVIFFAGPVYIVMVGEDLSFMGALRQTVGFTRSRAASYLGITLTLFLVLMGLGYIPQVGYYLSFITGALENLALGDLYTQYKKEQPSRAL